MKVIKIFLKVKCKVCLFVCLGFNVLLENFSLIWRRLNCRWRAANLTYARHFWPLSSEGSSACHTYCDKGHPFIMVISEYPWQSHLLPSLWQCSCHYLFKRLRSVTAGIRTPNLSQAMRTLLATAPPPRLQRSRSRMQGLCTVYWILSN